ncbi:hypothetical protein [Solitalea koreensis]|uniref:Uncharacterized protein n=1 Tax=Solitalea koreensis TaxID=543615 RepID=A0A521EKE6_9SPHI|nr:hypothetical protein [Solitalea koreensis]SMO84385.1 hypothetical protein SAMN06265350_11631 [Solitalea koreensis]
MKKLIIYLILLGVVIAGNSAAQEKKVSEGVMKTYFLVLLKKGPIGLKTQ